MSVENMILFTGNANPGLASEMAHRIGIGLGHAQVGQFSEAKSTSRSWRTCETVMFS